MAQEDFNWDTIEDEDNFFGDTDVSQTKDVIKEVEDEEESELSDEDKQALEDTKVIDSLFSEEEDEEEQEEEEKSVTSNTISSLNLLKDKGLLEFELEDGTELTEELAEEILQDKFEESIEKRVDELLEELPEELKELNKFVLKKGNFKEFLAKMIPNSTNSVINESSDINDEKIQEAVIREDLLKQGLEEDLINSQIELYKGKGKLGEISKKLFDKVIESSKQERLDLLEAQNNAIEQDKLNQRVYKSTLTKIISSNEITELTISPKDKKELPEYMANKSIKMQNGQSITQMQKDLYETIQDPKKAVILAKLLRSKFDFKEFSTKANTKVTKSVRENIQNNKPTVTSSGSGSSKNRGSLADKFFG